MGKYIGDIFNETLTTTKIIFARIATSFFLSFLVFLSAILWGLLDNYALDNNYALFELSYLWNSS